MCFLLLAHDNSGFFFLRMFLSLVFSLTVFYHAIITCHMPSLILLIGNKNLIAPVQGKFVGVVKRLRDPGSCASSSSAIYQCDLE